MKDFEEVVDEKKAERRRREACCRGASRLDDFLEQIRMMQADGSAQGHASRSCRSSPDGMPEGVNLDDNELGQGRGHRQLDDAAPSARRPELFEKQPHAPQARGARARAAPTRTSPSCSQRFPFMQEMMGNIGQQAGLLCKLPGMKQLGDGEPAAQRGARPAALEDIPMMANLADSLLEAAVAGGPAMPMRRRSRRWRAWRSRTAGRDRGQAQGAAQAGRRRARRRKQRRSAARSLAQKSGR